MVKSDIYFYFLFLPSCRTATADPNMWHWAQSSGLAKSNSTGVSSFQYCLLFRFFSDVFKWTGTAEEQVANLAKICVLNLMPWTLFHCSCSCKYPIIRWAWIKRKMELIEFRCMFSRNFKCMQHRMQKLCFIAIEIREQRGLFWEKTMLIKLEIKYRIIL